MILTHSKLPYKLGQDFLSIQLKYLKKEKKLKDILVLIRTIVLHPVEICDLVLQWHSWPYLRNCLLKYLPGGCGGGGRVEAIAWTHCCRSVSALMKVELMKLNFGRSKWQMKKLCVKISVKLFRGCRKLQSAPWSTLKHQKERLYLVSVLFCYCFNSTQACVSYLVKLRAWFVN